MAGDVEVGPLIRFPSKIDHCPTVVTVILIQKMAIFAAMFHVVRHQGKLRPTLPAWRRSAEHGRTTNGFGGIQIHQPVAYASIDRVVRCQNRLVPVCGDCSTTEFKGIYIPNYTGLAVGGAHGEDPKRQDRCQKSEDEPSASSRCVANGVLLEFVGPFHR